MVVLGVAFVLASAILAQAVPTHSRERLNKRDDGLGVPTGWREYGTTLVQSQRNTVAVNAMTKMLSLGGDNDSIGGLSYWQAANVWSALTLKDLYAGSTDFQQLGLDALAGVYSQYQNFRSNGYNDDTLWWGTAAVYQYEAYGDLYALGHAENCWRDVSQYQISGSSGNGKSFSWQSSCNGKSMNGGLWWTSDAGDQNTNAITTGLFMTLSARLYGATQNSMYLDAATAALSYIQNQLYDSSTNLVVDSLNPTNCQLTDWIFTYNSGKYIEGLTVLGAVTGDSDYTNAAITTANAGMKTAPWQGSDGIITEADNNSHNQNNDGWGFKAVWIRAIAELYRLNPNNGDLRILTHSYIDVQANALIELDSNTGNSDATEYGASWHGPFDTIYPWSQLAALDPLAAFVLANQP